MYHLMCKMLSAGLLMALLAGCATRIEYVRELPPVDLLADCPEPTLSVRTNGQLALSILALRATLAKCNIDKESLREWAKEDESIIKP